MPVTGDDARLRQLGRAMGRVAAALPLRRATEAFARDALERVRRGFAASVSPDGAPWAPLVYRTGQPLVKSGRLRDSIRGKLLGGKDPGFELRTARPFAGVHQDGAVITTTTRVNVHSKRGRFMSRARAARRKAGAVTVSISHAHAFRVPARPFFPTDRLPGAWAARWRALAAQIMAGVVGG